MLVWLSPSVSTEDPIISPQALDNQTNYRIFGTLSAAITQSLHMR